MDATAPTDLRKMRGVEIAKTSRIRKTDKGWVVPSQSGKGNYLVRLKEHEPTCNCADCETRMKKCKHIYAVEYILRKEIDETGKVKITKEIKTYPQDWKAYDQAKCQEKELFMKLLADLCKGIDELVYKFGRPKLSLSDMIFCSAFKVYSLYSLRRFETDIKIAKEKGLINSKPCFASVGHFMQREELTYILADLIKKSSMPLKSIETEFAVDSTGFSTSRFKRWYEFRYGREKNWRIWIKAHVVCGVKTNIVTAIKLSESIASDYRFFEELVTKTAENFEINEVSADKGYLSKNNFKIVDELGGTAYIPFKKGNTARTRHPRLWKKMWHLFMYNNDEFMKHYHKRSNVETTFHMIKSKFGDAVKSKTKTAQINEVLCKILCHNICVVIQEMQELGIAAQFEE